MYSPKIPERLIPTLYRLAQAQCRPMTAVVTEAIESYLAAQEITDLDLAGEEQATRWRPRMVQKRAA
jgi:predicted transcriptional regulator